jgi:subtilisin family serine protease
MKQAWQGSLVIAIGIVLWANGLGLAEEPRLIVGLRVEEGLLAQSVAEALEARLNAQASPSGIRVEHVFELIPAAVVRVSDPEALAALQGDPRVTYIVPDGEVATPERWLREPYAQPPSEDVFGAATPIELYNWGIQRIRAPEVHRASISPASLALTLALVPVLLGLGLVLPRRRRSGLGLSLIALGLAMGGLSGCTAAVVLPHPGVMGEGITVALLDTGVDLGHPDLKANIVGGVDFVNGDDDPQDDNGHGTGVAGLLAAVENGVGLIGTAPKAKVLVVKMLRYDEQGSISDLIRGIEWAVQRGAQIISMSLGTEEDNFALREAIQAAYRAGILLVAAAGNKGMRVLYPAAYPEVIAVAATDRRDQRAWFSNVGPEVELSAPGVELLTTGLDGDYQVESGTSFAVPQVAGVAALVMSTGLRDPAAVRLRLQRTADDLGLPISAQGYGLVDAERAVLGVGRP